MTTSCFHCGLPAENITEFPIYYRKQTEHACCAGCQAVAQTIIDSGLDSYYEHREGKSAQASALPLDVLQQIKLFDQAALQTHFVRTLNVDDPNLKEGDFILEGITCAACIWLNENHLRKIPGVQSVDINYTTHKMRIQWQSDRVQLSTILEAVTHIGYRAHPFDQAKQEQIQEKERKSALNRLWVAGLSMMQVMMYAVPVYVAQTGEIEDRYLWLLHWASLILTLPVILYSAWPFYQGTLRDLRTRHVGMDTPVTLGILTTFIASFYALIMHIEEGIYFDSVSMFVFLLLGGRYLENIARRQSAQATETLIKLIPAFAHKLSNYPQQRETQEWAVMQLAVNDYIVVRAGETIPVDGLIIEGRSSVSEAFLTGESQALPKEEGNRVLAGSQNLNSPLYLQVEHVGEATRLSSIVHLLDKALLQKPKLALLADRFAQYFVSILLIIAMITFAVWWQIDSARALWVMVAVLVVSCPCALSLATPVALSASTGRLAHLGVLTTAAHAIETLSKVTDVVWDKTGTLTLGKLRLQKTHVLADVDENTCLALAKTLEQNSEHPIAQAFHALAVDILPASRLENHLGFGLSAQIDQELYRLGKLDFVCKPSDFSLSEYDPNHTLIYLSQNERLIACFELSDHIREHAKECLMHLKDSGLTLHILSGDSQVCVESVAKTLAIDYVCAQASPENKLEYVQFLIQQNKVVAMIGDGVNDAPVLALANVSIAMGSGSDVARDGADMVLMNNDIEKIAEIFYLSRQTRTIIRQNLSWAILYNLVALPLAVMGLLTPWIASLGMAMSSLLVVINAMRLNPYWKK